MRTARAHATPRVPFCPRCRQGVFAERVVCRWCGVSHHPECWSLGNGCGYYACAGNPTVVPPAWPTGSTVTSRSVPVSMPGPSPTVIASVLGALACVIFGVIVWLVRDLQTEVTPSLSFTGITRPLSGERFEPRLTSTYVHDLSLDLVSGSATIRWRNFQPYEPTFQFGMRDADRSVPVTKESSGFRVDLAGLAPGQNYVYRITGFGAGPGETGRFTALPPDGRVPYRIRSRCFDLPDGTSFSQATFGRRRGVKPLWTRDGPLSAAGLAVPAGSHVDEGKAFCQDSGHLYAIDLTRGDVVWTHPVKAGQTPSSPASVGDVVLVASDREILGLEVASGRLRWRLPVEQSSWIGTCDEDFYVACREPKNVLYRIQACDGRLLSVIPVSFRPTGIHLEGDALVLHSDRGSRISRSPIEVGCPLDGKPSGDDFDKDLISTLFAWDRWRGQRRWEKVLSGNLPVALNPVVSGQRVFLAGPDRVGALSLKDGTEISGQGFADRVTALVPARDGSVLAATGGLNPRVWHLGPDLAVLRNWGMPEPILGGASKGDLAVVRGREGVYFLDFATGQRWGLCGGSPFSELSLTATGQVLLFGRSGGVLDEAPPNRVVALGLL